MIHIHLFFINISLQS